MLMLMFCGRKITKTTANNKDKRHFFLIHWSTPAQGTIRTMLADALVGSGLKSFVGREHARHGLHQQLIEPLAIRSNVENGLFAETQCGVIVLGCSMLDEEQGGRDGKVEGGRWKMEGGRWKEADDVGIDEGLQIIVAVIVNLFWGKDGIDI